MKILRLKNNDVDFSKFMIKSKLLDNRIVEFKYDGDIFAYDTGKLLCEYGGEYFESSVMVNLKIDKLTDFFDEMQKIAVKTYMKKIYPLTGIEIEQLEVISPVVDAQLRLYIKISPEGYFSAYDNDKSLKYYHYNVLMNRFSAGFLLFMNKLMFDGTRMQLKWITSVEQMRLYESTELPYGCTIFNTEQEAIDALKVSNSVSISTSTSTADEEPEEASSSASSLQSDVNELID